MTSNVEMMKERRALSIRAFAMNNAGKTIGEIAEFEGVSVLRVRTALNMNREYTPDRSSRRRVAVGRRAEQRAEREARADALAHLYNDGWSVAELAEQEGVSHQRISALLRHSEHFDPELAKINQRSEMSGWKRHRRRAV